MFWLQRYGLSGAHLVEGQPVRDETMEGVWGSLLEGYGAQCLSHFLTILPQTLTP